MSSSKIESDTDKFEHFKKLVPKFESVFFFFSLSLELEMENAFVY